MLELEIGKLSALLTSSLSSRPEYIEAHALAKYFSTSGTLWLAGGQIYRTIVNKLYRQPMLNIFDFDFLIERPIQQWDDVVVPNWQRSSTGTGGVRLQQGKKQVDIAYLTQAVHVDDAVRTQTMTTDELLTSYFRRTPLTIQSIVYNTSTGMLMGSIGVEAIIERTVAINGRFECEAYCRRHGFTIEDFVQQKASSLGFRAII